MLLKGKLPSTGVRWGGGAGVISQATQPRVDGVGSVGQCPVFPVALQEPPSSFRNFCFLICKTGVIVATSQVYGEDAVGPCEALRTAPGTL